MIDFKRIPVVFITVIFLSSRWLQLQNVRLILFQVSQKSKQYINILDFRYKSNIGFLPFFLFYPPSFANFPGFFDVNLEVVYKGVALKVFKRNWSALSLRKWGYLQKYGCIGYEGQMNEGQVFFIATHATMKMCKIKESTKISMWKFRADTQAQ